MIKLSANLGFLWTDRSLPDAIKAAKAAGFDAVECHWPYEVPATEVRSALEETGLSMLGLNTLRGNTQAGENGLSAMPGREAEAKAAIDQAFDYAEVIDCANVHVMAGMTDKSDTAKKTFTANVKYASERAASTGRNVLLEPLNRFDAPGYHLSTLDEAREALDLVGEANVKILFDCYHLQIMGGDLIRRFASVTSDVGHVQFASVPGRNEPDMGEIDYLWLLNEMADLGFSTPFGAEYKPRKTTDEGLGWMQIFRASGVG
jgi:2-dehydrotetronate isomerase